MTSREKMWAFLALLASTFAVMMAVILIGKQGAEPIVQLVDKYQNGIIGILGMAAGLLFRSSTAENDTAAAVRSLAAKASDPNAAPDVTLKPGETARAQPVPGQYGEPA